MKRFPFGHATHPDWRMAAGLVLTQLRAQMAAGDSASTPRLALLYITDHYAGAAEAILDALMQALPEITDWSGTVGLGIACANAEYFDEPALAVMLCNISPDHYRVFSGVAPLASVAHGPFAAHTALVQADAEAPELSELITELAARTTSGYLFGGLTASRSRSVQFAVAGDGNMRGQGGASGVFEGGVSRVAFSREVRLVSRITQGCQPLAGGAVSPRSSPGVRRVTAADGHLVLALDGEPALGVLLHDLQVSLDQPGAALAAVRSTLVGLTDARDAALVHGSHFGVATRVRHIIGIDPRREGVAVAEAVQVGTQLAFCRRSVAAARADLVRMCSEIREELAPPDSVNTNAGNSAAPERHMLGAVYVSCSARGGAHFGGASAEMQLVQHALGDVPLVGFFAAGEIAHHHLYAYAGVLTVFTD